jgi:hypothetical protein
MASWGLVAAEANRVVWLSSLDLTKMTCGKGTPQMNRSVASTPIRIAGRTFSLGVGTFARSALWIDLGGKADRFIAWVGVDEAAMSRHASVQFKVAGDGKLLWESGFMRRRSAPRQVDLKLDGIRTLLLMVTDGGDGAEHDFADWAKARIMMKEGAPKAIERPREEAVILTPEPGAAPRINGPLVYGCRNDPDYIQIGYIGSARGKGMPKPCPLYPSEQYAYMSLWALMASPLFYSGDMSQLDDFTLNVLCNAEVIAVNQDPLGVSGQVFLLSDDTFAMVKNLADGSQAVGLFNRGEIEVEVMLDWKVVDLTGEYLVRDLWRQKDLGTAKGQFRAAVPPHGVYLMRLSRVDPT